MIQRQEGKDNWSYCPVFTEEGLQLAPFFAVVPWLCAPPVVVSVMSGVAVTSVAESGGH